MGGSTRQSREHKKWLAARRGQFRLKQQFDYIDFVEDVLNPESEALLSGRVKLEIEADNDAAARSIIEVNLKENDETRRGIESGADNSRPDEDPDVDDDGTDADSKGSRLRRRNGGRRLRRP